MFGVLLVLTALTALSLLESVTIEYPSNAHIEERLRKDIDPILRHYITPREIQFHAEKIEDRLPYFLRCKGSKNSVKFAIPQSATKYLSFDINQKTHTITAKLSRNELTSDLVGRYTCSEKANNKDEETTAYVFIRNDHSVFTKPDYPTVFKQTGIHFFNLPCQTTSWYPRISCPLSSNSRQCQLPQCSVQERQRNELKCNTPVCKGQDLCIPVYYKPSNLNSQKVLFDPQIGFALENPTVSNRVRQFICQSNYTPSEASNIPFDSSEPPYLEIHQQSFTVLKDEVVQLSCEIQYGIDLDRKRPHIFWFEDIHNLQLISNKTEPHVLNPDTRLYSQKSVIILQGFKPGEVYRFYCVRGSDAGRYSRFVDITCAKAPSLDLDINPSGSDPNARIRYGTNGFYDVTILSVPSSQIQFDLLRDEQVLANDRFKLSPVNNREGRFWDYTLTIYNLTFDDEVNFKVTAKSSTSEKSALIKPKIFGNPVGELSFIPGQIPHSIPWRNDLSKIYPYGVQHGESYRIVCNVRHRTDQKRSLHVFIQYYPCSIDNCLSDLLSKTCRSAASQNSISTSSASINKYQTQVVSSISHKLDDPSIGHQYLCCYENNGLIDIAKAITVLSHHRSLLTINKPAYGLITGDTLTYSCEGHQLVYDDLQMIYKTGLLIYERNRLDRGWRLQGSRQIREIDVDWKSTISKDIRSMVIEVKTPRLTKSWNRASFQCIARSKRSNIIPDANEIYVIDVADAVPLVFKTKLPKVSRLDRKADDYVKLDCTFNGLPVPKLVWLRGKLPLNNSRSIYQFEENNGSLLIDRVRATETGYYTCILNNGRSEPLQRSFDLRVQGTNPYSRFGRISALIIIISVLLLLITLIVSILFACKYCQMRRDVKIGIYERNQAVGVEDETQPAVVQLERIPLPDNFASQNQIHTFLSYVNGKNLPATSEDFKELGRGQFGVVYQVRLPDVELVAAKILPESIRNIKHQREIRMKSDDVEETEEMLSKQKTRKTAAAEMLIDEIKVMHKAGKHVNIVALKKVAYPEAKVKYLFTGKPLAEEDSFYLMELCSNGSLESMLKRFLNPSPNSSGRNLSLYETLSQQRKFEMTVTQAHEQCVLTDDDLKLIAYQVASGVDYLNRRQIAHCDVAARNVLVTARFIMKICDFGLATWTTYKNYREQLEEKNSVQLEKKNNEIATHNLTLELARAVLRASTSNEQLLLNKSSIKSDVWSFGIFLWTLFLKCRIRPFNKLLEETRHTPDGGNFFHRLARMISDGHVLRYIDYHREIPRNIYGIIRDCLVEETRRPEMTRIRAYLCHSNMLSKRAFEYYRSEYNRYQEENAIDGNVERLSEDQGVSELPSFEDEYGVYGNPPRDDNISYRPTVNQGMYYPEPDEHVYQTVTKPSSPRTTMESNSPSVQTKKQAPIKPPKRSDYKDDSYL